MPKKFIFFKIFLLFFLIYCSQRIDFFPFPRVPGMSKQRKNLHTPCALKYLRSHKISDFFYFLLFFRIYYSPCYYSPDGQTPLTGRKGHFCKVTWRKRGYFWAYLKIRGKCQVVAQVRGINGIVPIFRYAKKYPSSIKSPYRNALAVQSKGFDRQVNSNMVNIKFEKIAKKSKNLKFCRLEDTQGRKVHTNFQPIWTFQELVGKEKM